MRLVVVPGELVVSCDVDVVRLDVVVSGSEVVVRELVVVGVVVVGVVRVALLDVVDVVVVRTVSLDVVGVGLETTESALKPFVLFARFLVVVSRRAHPMTVTTSRSVSVTVATLWTPPSAVNV